MKTFVRRKVELTVLLGSCLLVAACAGDPRPMVVGKSVALPAMNDYCSEAQREVASSRVPSRNVLMDDYPAFVRAQPSVRPLETLQYIGYSDPEHTKARMISCKLHTADRIRAEYGANTAGESASCARLNRRTLNAVMSSLSERQKKKMPFTGSIAVMLEPDQQAADESEWHEAFTMVHIDAGGTLRIRAKSLRAEWNVMKVGSVASEARGRQYCHLIAPDYLKRILLGEVQLAAD